MFFLPAWCQVKCLKRYLSMHAFYVFIYVGSELVLYTESVKVSVLPVSYFFFDDMYLWKIIC